MDREEVGVMGGGDPGEFSFLEDFNVGFEYPSGLLGNRKSAECLSADERRENNNDEEEEGPEQAVLKLLNFKCVPSWDESESGEFSEKQQVLQELAAAKEGKITLENLVKSLQEELAASKKINVQFCDNLKWMTKDVGRLLSQMVALTLIVTEDNEDFISIGPFNTGMGASISQELNTISQHFLSESHVFSYANKALSNANLMFENGRSLQVQNEDAAGANVGSTTSAMQVNSAVPECEDYEELMAKQTPVKRKTKKKIKKKSAQVNAHGFDYARFYRRDALDDGVYCICGKRFVGHHTLRRHVNNQTDEAKKGYFCEMCDKRFVYANLLRVHLHNDHSMEVQEDGAMACSLCKAVFETKLELVQHIDNIHPIGLNGRRRRGRAKGNTSRTELSSAEILSLEEILSESVPVTPSEPPRDNISPFVFQEEVVEDIEAVPIPHEDPPRGIVSPFVFHGEFLEEFEAIPIPPEGPPMGMISPTGSTDEFMPPDVWDFCEV